MSNSNLKPQRKMGGWNWTRGTRRLGRPIYWYYRDGPELWFVNWSDEVIPRLEASGVASATVDDDEYMVSEPATPIVYENIQPDEGVLVDVFTSIYDYDFLISTDVTVTQPDGTTKEYSAWDKGGAKTCRLLSPEMPEAT